MAVKTNLENLRVSGQDLIMKWTPGESRRLRVLPGPIYTLKRHWVEIEADGGETRQVPILCLGADCPKVLLANGQPLHQTRTDEEFRVFVWCFDLSELRILAGKRQIFGALQALQKRFGDVTKYDVMVSCVPHAGIGGRKYEVTPVPTGAYDLPEEAVERIAFDLNDEAVAVIDPLPLTIEEVLAKLPGATEVTSDDDESLLASAPAEE